ncbi:response regulator transcription factor [Nitrincola schmidtii]|uniref:response regulator transcription factor n=1 Tax=Nitrincola schmidtii TaxID=1730894 RepID=UPI00124E15B4|nr:response regulator transcription factor [Nitrincola schmidtii]
MRVAIIEDDIDQARLLAYWLKPYGFNSSLFISAEYFLKSTSTLADFNLILVDWLLPGMDGLSLVKRITETSNHPPIIFVTDKDKTDELATALHSGADDFISKPINKTILLARITSTLRRYGHSISTNSMKENELWLDNDSRFLYFDNQKCQLTRSEKLIMSLFLSMPGAPITREQLYEALNLEALSNSSRTIDIKISRLRKKLSQFTSSPGEITCQYGKGYIFKNTSSR